MAVASARRPEARRSRRPLPRILRRAEPRDLDRLRAAAERAAEARAFARERAAAQKLGIKVFRVDFQRGGRAIFYFASEARVDFRDLVRDLAARYHTRIELRQVGVRDEAKMVGGIGSCGRELCCTTFLPKFAPVSIKMAKHQNLAMAPTKVSGQCGRLKCCLVYEDATYVEAAAALPKIGKRVAHARRRRPRRRPRRAARPRARLLRRPAAQDLHRRRSATRARRPPRLTPRPER